MRRAGSNNSASPSSLLRSSSRNRPIIFALVAVVMFTILFVLVGTSSSHHSSVGDIGGSIRNGAAAVGDGVLQQIVDGGGDASYSSEGLMMNAFASDPKARRAMIHPTFQVPQLIKSLTDAAVKRYFERKQEEADGSPSSVSSFFPKSMGQLRPFLERSSISLRSRFNVLYEIEAKAASMRVPEAFAGRVKSMFSLFPGGLSGIENQTIITLYNKFTDEYSLFNEVRRYRPGYLERLKPEQEAEVNATYSNNAGPENCDFCSVERTAVDVFGRIESEHCYVASNVAKYEAWHSLIVSRHHNPLTFSAAILNDYFKTAQKWFEKVNSIDSDACFPFLSWDVGPRASASQIHQHLQIMLTHDRYVGKAENTRRAAAIFERRLPGKNYWQEVALAHAQMGLALAHGNTVILSHVCPVKEREVILITEDHTSLAFAEALNAAMEALRDDVGVRALSFGTTFHTVGPIQPTRGATPIGGASTASSSTGVIGGNHNSLHETILNDPQLEKKNMQHYPTVVRIIDRGSPLDKRSDSGAMEFFGANNVGADPFFFMPHLTERLAALQK